MPYIVPTDLKPSDLHRTVTADQILMAQIAQGMIAAFDAARMAGIRLAIMDARERAGRCLLLSAVGTANGEPCWRRALGIALRAGQSDAAALIGSQCVTDHDPLQWVGRVDPAPAAGVIECS